MPIKRDSVVRDIYDSFIKERNDSKVKNRYLGKENWYHSSSSGMCIRKHYFSSLKLGDEFSRDSNTYRLFRLGEIVHTDIQKAVTKYAHQNGLPILIENELFLEDLNVRGFIDLGLVKEGILYDIKTCNSWRWRLMFGRNANPQEVSKNYGLQLGTYGLWFKRKYGFLKGLTLVFYNKDNSQMRDYELDLDSVEKAKEYWENAHKIVTESIKNNKPPTLQLGSSPNQEWECNEKYCEYFNVCGGGIKDNF